MQALARQRSQGVNVLVDFRDNNITCPHPDVLNKTLPDFVQYSHLSCPGNSEFCSDDANIALPSPEELAEKHKSTSASRHQCLCIIIALQLLFVA
jgi:hypothetical protein